MANWACDMCIWLFSLNANHYAFIDSQVSSAFCQSYFCNIISFLFIFTSVNSSKNRKSNPCTNITDCVEQQPLVIRKILWCCSAWPQILSPNPISCWTHCCAGRKQQRANPGRRDQNAGVCTYTTCLPVSVDGQYTIAGNFFFPPEMRWLLSIFCLQA